MLPSPPSPPLLTPLLLLPPRIGFLIAPFTPLPTHTHTICIRICTPTCYRFCGPLSTVLQIGMQQPPSTPLCRSHIDHPKLNRPPLPRGGPTTGVLPTYCPHPSSDSPLSSRTLSLSLTHTPFPLSEVAHSH
eukprot:Sspe_Gene.6495::Locus_2186_Transcript_1_1_Confidence_1.000_Length_8729::g.6495::m.6495